MTDNNNKTLLIIDIDNTLAENAQREHLLPNWNKFFKACDTDTPILEIIDVLSPYFNRDDIDIIFVTGRSGISEVIEKTKFWLSNYFPERPSFFRPYRNFTKAPLFKQKIVDEYKKDNHTNIIIIDDDVRITDHFISLGHQAILIDKADYPKNVEQIKSLLDLDINFVDTKKSIPKSR